MPLQIRRGTAEQKNAMTVPLAEGELLWTTDDQRLYVGRVGILPNALSPVVGFNAEDAQDAAAALFNHAGHTGITFQYNDTLNKLVAVVSSSSTFNVLTATKVIGSVYSNTDHVLVNVATSSFHGDLHGDVHGSVFANDSTMLVDAISGVLRGTHAGDVFGSLFAADGSVRAFNAATGHLEGRLNGSVYTNSGLLKIIDGTTGNITASTTGIHYGELRGNLISDNGTIYFDALANTGNGQLSGYLNGNASSANQLNIEAVTAYTGDSGLANGYIPYVYSSSGIQIQHSYPSLRFNPLLQKLTVDKISAALTGNVYSSAASLAFDASNGNLYAPLYANVHKLNGSIMVNATNASITAEVVTADVITIGSSNLNGTSITYSEGQVFSTLVTTTANTTPFIRITASRSTILNKTSLFNNDLIGGLEFKGYVTVTDAVVASITASADADVANFGIPGRLNFSTTAKNGISLNNMTFDSDGILTVPTVHSNLVGDVLNSAGDLVISPESNTVYANVHGDLKGSVFADDSSMIIDGTNGTLYGTLLGKSASTGGVTVYADQTSRDTALPNGVVAVGMLCMIVNNGSGFAKFQGNTTGLITGWVDLN